MSVAIMLPSSILGYKNDLELCLYLVVKYSTREYFKLL